MEVQATMIDLEFDHTQIELTNRELRALFLKEIDDFR
jgi:precorrin-6B methylase 2